jgi:hypothetical protein
MGAGHNNSEPDFQDFFVNLSDRGKSVGVFDTLEKGAR